VHTTLSTPSSIGSRHAARRSRWLDCRSMYSPLSWARVPRDPSGSSARFAPRESARGDGDGGRAPIGRSPWSERRCRGARTRCRVGGGQTGGVASDFPRERGRAQPRRSHRPTARACRGEATVVRTWESTGGCARETCRSCRRPAVRADTAAARAGRTARRCAQTSSSRSVA
jgi:hypothetical protein